MLNMLKLAVAMATMVTTSAHADAIDDAVDYVFNPEKYCTDQGERQLSVWVREQDTLDMKDLGEAQESLVILHGILASRTLSRCSPLYMAYWKGAEQATLRYKKAVDAYMPLYTLSTTKKREDLSAKELKGMKRDWDKYSPELLASADAFMKSLKDSKDVLMPDIWEPK